MRKSRWIVGIAVFLCLVLIPGGILALVRRPGKVPAALRSAVAERGTLSVLIPGEGTLTPATSEEVLVRIGARVAQVYAQAGDHVEAGQTIALLASDALSAELQQAANAVGASGEALEAQAREEVTAILAPISGYVKSLHAQAGDMLDGLSGPLAVLSDGPMSLTLTLPKGQETQVGALLPLTIGGARTAGEVLERIGQTLRLRVPDAGYSPGSLASWVGEDGATLASGALSVAHPVVIAGLSGVVEEIHVAPNQHVAAGDVLLTILDISAAGALQAEWSAQQEAAQTLSQVQLRAQDLTVTAPISGLLGAMPLAVGQEVTEGNLAARIERTNPYSAYLRVHEDDIARVKVGQTATLTLPALPGQTFVAPVARVLPQATRTDGGAFYDVEVQLSEVPGMLPGMTVSASIEVDFAEAVCIVPIEAITLLGGAPYVLLLPGEEALAANAGLTAAEFAQEQPAYLRPVTLGAMSHTHVEILAGLSAGEGVVLFDAPADLSAYVAPLAPIESTPMPSAEFMESLESLPSPTPDAALIADPNIEFPTSTVAPDMIATDELAPYENDSDIWLEDFDVPWPE